MNFRKNTKPWRQEKKQEKEIVIENLHNFFEARENILDAFESKIFSTKSKGADILNPNGSKLKLLTHKQVKAGNNSESLSNKIRQIFYSLYQSREITKKVYNNIIISINI